MEDPQVICPCCGGQFRTFLPYGVRQRPNAMCPGCGSKERHRLLWLYFENRTNLFSQTLRVLHLVPEKSFQKTLASLPTLDCISADLQAGKAMVEMDITNILYETNSFDVILCSHVLEHVVDDRKAMRELFRVLKPGGWEVLHVPIDLEREKTFEDPSIVLPEDRERIFCHWDHVRIYGRDYNDRLEEAGFTLNVHNYARELGADMIKKYGLRKHAGIYFCTKWNRKKVSGKYRRISKTG